MVHQETQQQAGIDDGLDHVRLAAMEQGRWALDLLDDWNATFGPDYESDRSDGSGTAMAERHRLAEEFFRRVREGDDADVRAGVLCLLLSEVEPSGWVERCAKRRLAWQVEQATVLWRLVMTQPTIWWTKWVELALTTLPGLDTRGLAGLAPLLRDVDERLSAKHVSRYDGVAKLIQELRSHLSRVDGPSPTLPQSVLPPRDQWAIEVRSWCEAEASPDIVALVVHLATLTTTRPSRTWRRTCADLAATNQDVREFPRRALNALLACEPTVMRHAGRNREALLDEVRNVDVARGTVWAAAVLEGDAVAHDLENVFLRTALDTSARPEPRVATAVVHALGSIEGTEAKEVLRRLRPKVFETAVLKQIDAALAHSQA